MTSCSLCRVYQMYSAGRPLAAASNTGRRAGMRHNGATPHRPQRSLDISPQRPLAGISRQEGKRALDLQRNSFLASCACSSFFFPLLSVIGNRPVVQLWSTAPPPCPPVLGLLLGCKPYSPTLPHISSHQTTPHRGPPVPTPVRRGRSPTGRASSAFSELRFSRACPKLLYTLFLRHSTTWLSGARIVPDGTADITFVEVLSRTVGATLA